MPIALRFDDILEQLHSPDERERERAARHLIKLGRIGLNPEQGIRAIKASALPYPERRDGRADTSVDLLRAALAVPYPEYLPQILQRFALWENRARAEVMNRLTRIEDPRAAETIVAILGQHARSGRVRKLPLGLYASSPRYAEVLFPALFDYLDVPRLRLAVCQYALSFAAAHLIDPEQLRPHSQTILEMYHRRRDKLAPRQQSEGIAWRWSPRYHQSRWTAGILLDLLGFVPTSDAIAALREAEKIYTDPRLKMYAILGLMRQNEEVPAQTVAEVAACPECRKWLFDGLQKLERFQLYPVELRTQAALAESDLVDWLVHAQELGRAPDTLELMDVVPFDSDGEAGWLDYYLFRYRVSGRHWAARSGWLVGLAGPFLRKESPSIQSLGDTHSTYRCWDEKPLAGHVHDVRQLMRSWRERHLSRESD